MSSSFFDSDEEDEWHVRHYHRGWAHVRRPPGLPPARRSGGLLDPGVDEFHGTSIRRSRSQGQSPAPNIWVWNTADRSPSPAPSPAPAARGRAPVTVDVADRLGDIDRSIRRLSRGRNSRSRSGGLTPWQMQMQIEERRRNWEQDMRLARLEIDRWAADHGEPEREELQRVEAELKALRARSAAQEEQGKWEEREKALKKQIQLEQLQARLAEQKIQEELDEREKAKAKEWEEKEKAMKHQLKMKEIEDELKRKTAQEEAKLAHERVIMEWKLKEEKEAAERKRIVKEAQEQEAERKKKEDEKAKAAVAKYEQDKKDAAARDDELRKKFKAEEEAKAKKAAADKAEFKLKLKMEEDAAKAADKKQEEEYKMKFKLADEAEKEKMKAEQKKLEDEVHKKLAVFGFQENQIQAVLDPSKAAALPLGASPLRPMPAPPPAVAQPVFQPKPTYIKIAREHIELDTLRYYGLAYELDRTDPRYLIILREISEYEVEVLFQHTRRLRRGSTTLFIEDRGRRENPQWAFVRRRKASASPAPRRRSPVKIGLRLF